MIRAKSVRGPTIDGYGQFFLDLGEFNHFHNDNPSQRLASANITAGDVVIALAVTAANPLGTSGLSVGDTIRIQDTLASEVRQITAVTPGVSIGLAAVTNSYTTARGARITVLSVAHSTNRVSCYMDDPLTPFIVYSTQLITGNAMRIYGTLSAPFTPGELVTGAPSGATGRVIGQGANFIDVLPIQGTAILADTVTGGDSGSTVTAITNFVPLAPTVGTAVMKLIPGTFTSVWTVAVTADVAGMLFTLLADMD